MKDEYDFSGGERGKFYRPGARLTRQQRHDLTLNACLIAALACAFVADVTHQQGWVWLAVGLVAVAVGKAFSREWRR